MSVKRSQEIIAETTNSETPNALKGEILSAWNQLPGEFKATLIQTLVQDVQNMEVRDSSAEIIAYRTKKEKETESSTYPVYSLNRENLEQAFSEEEFNQFGDQDIRRIAEELRNGFLFDSGFWYAVKMVGEDILEERAFFPDGDSESHDVWTEQIVSEVGQDYSRWMKAVDQAVWISAGCSVYDLPDCNFRSMFDEGAASAEAVNEVLQNAGFEFEE